ncbi:MAG: inositol monophosphatase family protein [Candidatus Liptonbacteria bacterium]|nr:inositol monophosphatase family protein [Candidatus Liptonbacteria bacterium]
MELALMTMFYGVFTGLKPVYEKYLAKGQLLRSKAEGELVGEMDDDLDKRISDFLSENFAGIPVISEEKDSEWPPKETKFFVLDPCDGTHNAAIEAPIFGSMLALIDDGEVAMSVIYLPFHPAGLYLALRGAGAWQFQMNETPKRISVSEKKTLKEAFLLLEGQTQNNFGTGNEFALRAIRNTKRTRLCLSSCWSGTRIASGSSLPTSADVLISTGNKPTDNLPIALLVEEAGGEVTDHFGNPWSLENCNSLVLSNGHLHEQILALNGFRKSQRVYQVMGLSFP